LLRAEGTSRLVSCRVVIRLPLWSLRSMTPTQLMATFVSSLVQRTIMSRYQLQSAINIRYTAAVIIRIY